MSLSIPQLFEQLNRAAADFYAAVQADVAHRVVIYSSGPALMGVTVLHDPPLSEGGLHQLQQLEEAGYRLRAVAASLLHESDWVDAETHKRVAHAFGSQTTWTQRMVTTAVLDSQASLLQTVREATRTGEILSQNLFLAAQAVAEDDLAKIRGEYRLVFADLPFLRREAEGHWRLSGAMGLSVAHSTRTTPVTLGYLAEADLHLVRTAAAMEALIPADDTLSTLALLRDRLEAVTRLPHIPEAAREYPIPALGTVAKGLQSGDGVSVDMGRWGRVLEKIAQRTFNVMEKALAPSWERFGFGFQNPVVGIKNWSPGGFGLAAIAIGIGALLFSATMSDNHHP